MADAPAEKKKSTVHSRKSKARTPQAVVKKAPPAPSAKDATAPRASSVVALPKAPPLGESDTVLAGASHKPIPGAPRLLWKAILILRDNWRVLLGLAAVYLLLNVLLVQGLNTAANLTSNKETLNSFTGGGVSGHLTSGLSLYGYLLGASGSSLAPTAGVYQFVLSVVFTLAIIWALRQIYAGRTFRLRDAFYYGMYPLITFFLVLLTVILHLLPFALGSVLYGIVSANGIATTPFESLSFLVVFLLLTAVSVYLLCSSLLALYIVTLPEVTPMAALRSARDLVVHRRWTIMRKVIFMPFVLVVAGGVVLVPVVLFATVLAPWIFAGLAATLLVLLHTYMYTLYRSLL